MERIKLLIEEREKAWAEIGEIIYRIENPELVNHEIFDLELKLANKKIHHLLQWIKELNSLIYKYEDLYTKELFTQEPLKFTDSLTFEERLERMFKMRQQRLANIAKLYFQYKDVDPFVSYEEHMKKLRLKKELEHEMNMYAQLQEEILATTNYYDDVKLTV